MDRFLHSLKDEVSVGEIGNVKQIAGLQLSADEVVTVQAAS